MIMEIAIIFGSALLVGGIYELIRPKRRNNNEEFLVFYDSFGVRNILHLNRQDNILNSHDNIDKYTNSYVSTTDMGVCTISQDNIIPGDDIIELRCGHFFKKEYGVKWLEQHNECPLCREKFNF